MGLQIYGEPHSSENQGTSHYSLARTWAASNAWCTSRINKKKSKDTGPIVEERQSKITKVLTWEKSFEVAFKWGHLLFRRERTVVISFFFSFARRSSRIFLCFWIRLCIQIRIDLINNYLIILELLSHTYLFNRASLRRHLLSAFASSWPSLGLRLENYRCTNKIAIYWLKYYAYYAYEYLSLRRVRCWWLRTLRLKFPYYLVNSLDVTLNLG